MAEILKKPAGESKSENSSTFNERTAVDGLTWTGNRTRHRAAQSIVEGFLNNQKRRKKLEKGVLAVDIGFRKV